MTTATIFGSGNMGTALEEVMKAGGADVEHIGSQDNGTVNGDIVVLAVPYNAMSDIASKYKDQLDGKIVVDISNPMNGETYDDLVVPPESSATAELAQALPGAKVVKAFNTNFAATLSSKHVGDDTTTVLIAGDDSSAKETLAGVVSAAGLNAVDAGSMKRARELEALGLLQITLAAGGKIGWTGGMALNE